MSCFAMSDARLAVRLKCNGYSGEMANLLQRVVIEPLMRLLRMGATPEQLAWSIALGMVVGINPLIGSTTIVALVLAGALRLNFVASQVGNHVVYPLELLLFPVFLKLGSKVFGSQRLPLDGKALMGAVRHHPWDTTRMLWMWEWHALVVWAVAAAVLMPLLSFALRPALRKLLARMPVEIASPS
jgi:uncharacterized protein (DUF2062 family)